MGKVYIYQAMSHVRNITGSRLATLQQNIVRSIINNSFSRFSQVDCWILLNQPISPKWTIRISAGSSVCELQKSLAATAERCCA